jgi:hypothetical protein
VETIDAIPAPIHCKACLFEPIADIPGGIRFILDKETPHLATPASRTI